MYYELVEIYCTGFSFLWVLGFCGVIYEKLFTSMENAVWEFVINYQECFNTCCKVHMTSVSFVELLVYSLQLISGDAEIVSIRCSKWGL